ncbi:hypothetical protein GCM10009864_57110 [Streptomyces lunalinharesii]|uniref:Uncharacterized protein n=1 Tax=Streptomyces lunalinharesii TaxID=333384 RepID=A0ABN3SLT7_9ACTN
MLTSTAADGGRRERASAAPKRYGTQAPADGRVNLQSRCRRFKSVCAHQPKGPSPIMAGGLSPSGTAVNGGGRSDVGRRFSSLSRWLTASGCVSWTTWVYVFIGSVSTRSHTSLLPGSFRRDRQGEYAIVWLKGLRAACVGA